MFGDNQISSLGKLNDEELSNRVKEGDNQAFEVLYDKYKDKIFSYVRNILNYNKDDATTVLSDVFIKVFEYIKSYEVKNFKTFIYRIAHNTAIDLIRTSKTGIYTDEENAKLVEDKQSMIEKENLNTQFKQNIMIGFLSQIEEKFRNVLYLYYFEEKSYEEIAEIMESNKNSVGTMISNAKKILKEKIKDENIIRELEN
ncbi:MAG: RNA polymerase sigma factor [Candidatus Absconditicoccaceae bacterium]